ncbi:calcium-binding protein, partial [Mesorhizobium sp. LNHC209A00]|uniref:calcium-binding protein n=1 Tax=Mesorhizobium sp. LNHC209A00 TaxID=1287226 RepID=UPI002477E2B1
MSSPSRERVATFRSHSMFCIRLISTIRMGDQSSQRCPISLERTSQTFETPTDSGGDNIYDVTVQVSKGTLADNQAIAVTVTDVAGQTITGTNAAQTLTGGPEADTILGVGGNDTLNGLAGGDTLDGGAGADTMVGGTGNDIYVVDNTGDIVDETGGDGTDLVRSSIAFNLS